MQDFQGVRYSVFEAPTTPGGGQRGEGGRRWRRGGARRRRRRCMGQWWLGSSSGPVWSFVRIALYDASYEALGPDMLGWYDVSGRVVHVYAVSRRVIHPTFSVAWHTRHVLCTGSTRCPQINRRPCVHW